jgi:HEPN domain-containing protein
MVDKVDYWLSITEGDLRVIHILYENNEYLHAAFFCQLVAEKALKANFTAVTNEVPPKTHDLMKLAEKGDLLSVLSTEQKELFRQLQPMNIEAKYPEVKKALALTLNKEICAQLISDTEEFLCWIKTRLGK